MASIFKIVLTQNRQLWSQLSGITCSTTLSQTCVNVM